jgi:altronate dehydratase
MRGYVRQGRAPGVRNHILALPAVVCATSVVEAISGGDVVGIVHQHGCLHVGDDLRNSRRVLRGVALNPNVAAVLVVSLGCETLNGSGLAADLARSGQLTQFVGIQDSGGTTNAVGDARARLERLRWSVRQLGRSEVRATDLTLGIEGAEGPRAGLATAAQVRGFRTVVGEGRPGSAQHAELASAGAQIIVSLLEGPHVPVGFSVCPVLAVAVGPGVASLLVDDVDIDGVGLDSDGLYGHVFDQVASIVDGAPTLAEAHGSREFALRRIAMTM